MNPDGNSIVEPLLDGNSIVEPLLDGNAADPTVEQLLDDDLAGESLGAKLDAIRQDASGDGVAVTVDLHGRLVALTIDHTAMRLPAHALAAKIKAHADEAATAALAEAQAVLSAGPPPLRALYVSAGTGYQPAGGSFLPG
jgi:hypothetical protein